MIEYVKGDIFDSPAQVIVNPVNTVGVMGKGLALSFKERYPHMFKLYKQACEEKIFSMGKLMLVYEPDHWIMLFPTKENWRNPSKIEYIETGLKKFVDLYVEKNITSIAFPKLGCGNGELDWALVQPVMESYLKDLPINIYIYLSELQENTPEHKQPIKTLKWLRNNAKDMSFVGLKDDIELTCSKMCPNNLFILGEMYSVVYDDGLVFVSDVDEEKIVIHENDLFHIWDDIRRDLLFSVDVVLSDKLLVCELLYTMGYLSRVEVFDKKNRVMKQGFQVNEGLNRIFSFAEGE